MGFFDENPDLIDGGGSGGGDYITKEGKKELIESGRTFVVTEATFDEGLGYDGADRYALTVILDGEEESRLLTFNTSEESRVESRDQFCERLIKYLEDPANEPPVLKLTKIGRSQILVSADLVSEEEEAPAKPAAKRSPAKRATAAKPATRGKRVAAKK